jgi:hypothetical protein
VRNAFGVARVLGFIAFASFISLEVGSARGQLVVTNTVIPNGYHSQVTNYFCGAASMEMQLDTPVVLAANPGIVGALNTVPNATLVDGPTSAGAVPPAGAQASIYSDVHGGAFAAQSAFAGGFVYNDPLFGPGTDPKALAVGLSDIDNTGVYTTQGFNPGLVNGDLASRTLVDALTGTQVPATVSVESGAHWIDVHGVSVTTNVNTGNYAINGFIVRDPWTGYAISQANAGNFAPALAGGFGLGFNTYLRYGYDIIPGAAITQLPNGQLAPVRLGAWFNYFNPSSAGGGFPLFNTPKYIIETDPRGPTGPDTGDNGTENSLPAPPADLSQELNSSGADGDAISDLAGNSLLDSEPGLEGGSFDSGDEMLMSDASDPSGEGDWLVPYDGSGGINDVTGAVMIDADTGVIDEATWFDGTDGISSVPLSQIDSWFADQEDGLLPQDNITVPEPATLSILACTAPLLLARRRRAA